MPLLCINSRDELLLIEMEKIAYLKAQGNYTELTYIGGQKLLLTLGLSKLELMIREAMPKNGPGIFARMGRSLIINQRYLTRISVLNQKLTLSDRAANTYVLSVSKDLLKGYKKIVADSFKHQTEKK